MCVCFFHLWDGIVLQTDTPVYTTLRRTSQFHWVTTLNNPWFSFLMHAKCSKLLSWINSSQQNWLYAHLNESHANKVHNIGFCLPHKWQTFSTMFFLIQMCQKMTVPFFFKNNTQTSNRSFDFRNSVRTDQKQQNARTMSFAPIVLTMHDHTVSLGWKLLFFYYDYCWRCCLLWKFCGACSSRSLCHSPPLGCAIRAFTPFT